MRYLMEGIGPPELLGKNRVLDGGGRGPWNSRGTRRNSGSRYFASVFSESVVSHRRAGPFCAAANREAGVTTDVHSTNAISQPHRSDQETEGPTTADGSSSPRTFGYHRDDGGGGAPDDPTPTRRTLRHTPQNHDTSLTPLPSHEKLYTSRARYKNSDSDTCHIRGASWVRRAGACERARGRPRTAAGAGRAARESAETATRFSYLCHRPPPAD
ncbi:hypothetical protein EVAR_5036_1 [Eumeta japonica]|uniref:Uncharacterized protein n=1 Tax=Eumeta variegata TaxID=151549 RepID=A0A4C1SU68_EUMVA|nr:hypothetical protein EVAR_5036_1 [Eumeta japonica]